MNRPSRIRCERRLPLPGEVLCRIGEVVLSDYVIAKTELVPGNPYILDIQRELGVKAEDIRGVMLKGEGEPVRTGEVVARAKGRQGVQEVRAQADGVIEFISTAYGRVLVREEVKPDHPLITLNVASKLGIPPWQIRFFTRVKEEDEVRQGTVLASESMGSFSGLIYSPVTGVVEKICGRTGTITIRRPYRPTLVHAYIPGEVVDLIPGFGAVIQGSGYRFEGVLGLGGEAFGPPRVVCATDEVFDEHRVTEGDAGKILVGGSMITSAAVKKAIECRVKAVCSGGIDIESLEALNVGIRGITGAETLGITLLIMHGFGPQPLSERLSATCREFRGIASVTGATQMRTGVKRPELLLCDQSLLEEVKAQDDLPPVQATIGPGVAVRVLMGAHQGKPAEVLGIESERHVLATGEITEVASVRFQTGTVARVPILNLKVIA